MKNLHHLYGKCTFLLRFNWDKAWVLLCIYRDIIRSSVTLNERIGVSM